MTFANDFPAAARRHLRAAEQLDGENSRDIAVAGYLYGIAAECAVKAMMIDAGMRPKKEVPRREDQFFVLFPELRTMLRDALGGRRGIPLIAYIQNDAFLNNWCTRMRYSHGRDVGAQWVSTWAKQARQVVASIGT
jgi:hypothetical protein